MIAIDETTGQHVGWDRQPCDDKAFVLCEKSKFSFD